MRADGRWTKAYDTWLADSLGTAPAPPAAGVRTGSVISVAHGTTRPDRPRPVGPAPRSPRTALRYLEALGTWRDEPQGRARRARRRRRSAAADGTAYTGDLLLSMALWKAVADRHDLLVATWDSGRVGRHRAGAALHPGLGRLDATARARAASRAPAAHPGPRALAVSLPEACRLSDALAARCAPRLGLDPVGGRPRRPRLRALRASVERVRDLVDRAAGPAAGTPRRRVLDAARHAALTDVTGPGAARRRRRRPAGPAGAGRGPRRARPHRGACDRRAPTPTTRPGRRRLRRPSSRRAAHAPARPSPRGAWPGRPGARARPCPTCRRARPGAHRRRPPSTPTWSGSTPSAGR